MDLTVRRKIPHDINDIILVLILKKEIDNNSISTLELYGKTQALMCLVNNSE